MASDKKTDEVKPNVKPNIYSKLYELAASDDFEREATGFAPYWKPNMFCTRCPATNKFDPGRKLSDREFACEVEDEHGKKHGKEFLLGSIFCGRVMARDVKPQTDPKTGEVKDFVRWLFLATRESVPCFQGPTQEVERIDVRSGEPFNVSNYETLKFEDFLGCEIIVIAKSKRSLSGPEPKTLWNFDLRITKDMKKELDAQRLASAEQARRLLQERARERMKQLAGAVGTAPTEQETAQAVAE